MILNIIEESEIIDATRQIANKLKITAEPTSCVAAAACFKWLSEPKNRGKTALIMLSGGNIDQQTMQKIWL